MDARISCNSCAFRHVSDTVTLREAPIRSRSHAELALLPRIKTTGPAEIRRAKRKPRDERPSVPGALAALSLSVLLASLGTSAANVGLPTFARTFGASFQAVQWIVLAYLLAVTTLVVGAGRLGDVTGRRRLLLAGIGIFTGASLLCGLAPTLPVLIVARGAQGAGAAIMMALTLAFIGDAVPKARTGSAVGLLGTMSALGTALGPSLGGMLLAGPGWRALFLVNVPLAAIALLLTHRYLPVEQLASRANRPAIRRSFDVLGTGLLAATLGAYALAMTIGRGHIGASNLALLVVAMLGGALFVRVEARVESTSGTALVRPSTLQDRTLVMRLVSNTLISAVMMATLVVGPFYLARALGLQPALVGLVMSVGPLVTAVTGVPAGRLSDRQGPRQVTIGGLVAMAAGSMLLAALPTTLGVAGYVTPIAIVTAGYALFQTANNAAVLSDLPADQRGVIAGLLGLSRNLGLVTGASVMGALFSFASGSVDVAAAPAGAVALGMRITFASAAALVLVALLLASGVRVRPTCSRVLHRGTMGT